MKATKTWHCECCGEAINPGEEMRITEGNFFKKGHTMTEHEPTSENPTIIEREHEPKKKERDFLAKHFIVCHITEPVKKIKTEQLELVKVPRDYTKHRRELPEQQDTQDLPLFNLEYQKTEQLSLF